MDRFIKKQSVAVLCRATQDLIITIPRSDAISILSEQDVQPEGVHFFSDRNYVLDIARRLEVNGQSQWAPGGSLSNTIYSLASCQSLDEQELDFIWLGVTEYSDFAGTISPIDFLRRQSIRPFCQSQETYSRFAVCIIAAETKDVICIIIYHNETTISYNSDWPLANILVTSIYEISVADDTLLAFIKQSDSLALIIGDHEIIDNKTQQRLEDLADLNKIKWILGYHTDFLRLGFYTSDGVIDSMNHIEFVGTQGPNPVIVWEPITSNFLSYNVTATTSMEHNTLGAGDAYTGGYLFHRITGRSIEEAHKNGTSCAKKVLCSSLAHAEPQDNLNILFGKLIDRHSTRDNDGAIYNRIRLSPGLVILSCGQTGVDQIAVQVASDLGIPAYAILPAGRRTESTEGILSAQDNFADAYVMEIGSNSYRFCTWTNVFLSDGTLIWDYHNSEGSAATREAAERLNRPYLDITRIPSHLLADTISRWVLLHNIRVLNIAGNRASLLNSEEKSVIRQQIDYILRLLSWLRMQESPVVRQQTEFITKPTNHIALDNSKTVRIGIPNARDSRMLLQRFLFDKFGIQPPPPRKLVSRYNEIGIEVFYARARDLPTMLRNGIVDIIFCGSDLLDEAQINADILLYTGLQPCHIALVGLVGSGTRNLKIGTQYPNIAPKVLNKWYFENSLIQPILGSAEAWIGTGHMDAAIDTWRTGYTAEVNDLKLLKIFYSTSLVLASFELEKQPHTFNILSFTNSFRDWLGNESTALSSHYF